MPREGAQRRVCPVCGEYTPERRCPTHDVPTVNLSRGARTATSYSAGDVVSERYRITGSLGRGGFGEVYAAEHVSTGQAVALKMLALKTETAEPPVVQRFFREARITAQLTDPHTVRVFDTGQADDGPLYIAMELLRGPTLEEVLRRLDARGETMSAEQTVDLAGQVLKSLAEAHGMGLVHRDLKPANVILAEVGAEETVAKVLDFGIARTQDSNLTATGRTMGTPHYMSPEQFQGGGIDGRSDLYSLAVLLYRCLSGRLPFQANTPYGLMHGHLYEIPQDVGELADVPEALAACVMCALAKDPNARFDTAKAMRSALQAALPKHRAFRQTSAWSAELPGVKQRAPQARVWGMNSDEQDVTAVALATPTTPGATEAPAGGDADIATMGLDAGTLEQLAVAVDARARASREEAAARRAAHTGAQVPDTGVVPTRGTVVDEGVAGAGQRPVHISTATEVVKIRGRRKQRDRKPLWIGGAVAAVALVALGLTLSGGDEGAESTSGAPAPAEAQRAGAAPKAVAAPAALAPAADAATQTPDAGATGSDADAAADGGHDGDAISPAATAKAARAIRKAMKRRKRRARKARRRRARTKRKPRRAPRRSRLRERLPATDAAPERPAAPSGSAKPAAEPPAPPTH